VCNISFFVLISFYFRINNSALGLISVCLLNESLLHKYRATSCQNQQVMNRKINHHVSSHQVSEGKQAVVMIFCPSNLNVPGINLISSLIRLSIDFGSDTHRDASLVTCNVWKTSKEMLLPALQSIPRHFKNNTSASLQIIFLSHGSNGNLVWNNDSRIETRSLLTTLEALHFPQLESVVLLGCSSLKNVRIPQLSYDVVGFSDYFYWNEFPIFVSRLVKEYFSGESTINAVKQAKKSCSVSNVTPFPPNSLVFCAKTKK
jgi:hypothetical protein